MKAGDIVKLTDSMCLHDIGTKGVLVNATSRNRSKCEIIVLALEGGTYMDMGSYRPLNVIGHNSKYIRPPDQLADIVTEISLDGIVYGP